MVRPEATLPMLKTNKRYLVVGTILTMIWLGVGIVVVVSNWPTNGLKPNEWGDVFAGFFAPLAFLWLVLGFRLQTEALAASTKATETLISTERPYVTVGGDYKKNSDKSIFEDQAGDRFFRLEVGNYGKTPATLTAFDVRYATLEKVQMTPNDVLPRNSHNDLLAPTEKHKVLHDKLKIEKGAKVVYGAVWYRSPLGEGDLKSCFVHMLGDEGTEVHVPRVHESYRTRD